jgi:hypothetical protein
MSQDKPRRRIAVELNLYSALAASRMPPGASPARSEHCQHYNTVQTTAALLADRMTENRIAAAGISQQSTTAAA